MQKPGQARFLQRKRQQRVFFALVHGLWMPTAPNEYYKGILTHHTQNCNATK